MIDIASSLSPTEAHLWTRLKNGAPLRITSLARQIKPEMWREPVRRQQQFVAAYISRINRKLPKGYRIVPGEPRHTYQLRKVTER